MATPVNKKIVALLISFAFIITACNSSSNYAILSFFFDGVPDPNKPKVEVKTNVIDSTGIKKREAILKKAASKYILHGPYAAKLCGDCHNMNQGFSLLKKKHELCYDCHDNYEKIPKFPHGPVLAGLCTECHHPHRSKNKFLLTETGNKLCFKCHLENDITENKFHPSIGKGSCVTCHDPHGSNRRYFLPQ